MARLPLLSAHHMWKNEGDSAAALRNNRLVRKVFEQEKDANSERRGNANSGYTDCEMEMGKNTENVRKHRLKTSGRACFSQEYAINVTFNPKIKKKKYKNTC